MIRRLRWLIALAGAVGCFACATAPPPVEPDAWHTARVVEALVNGCSQPCPSDEKCIDDFGLCYTPCAWKVLDAAERKALHESALATDPTRTMLIDCRQPTGIVEARR